MPVINFAPHWNSFITVLAVCFCKSRENQDYSLKCLLLMLCEQSVSQAQFCLCAAAVLYISVHKSVFTKRQVKNISGRIVLGFQV